MEPSPGLRGRRQGKDRRPRKEARRRNEARQSKGGRLRKDGKPKSTHLTFVNKSFKTRIWMLLWQRDQSLAESISNPSPPCYKKETHLGHRRPTLIFPWPRAILWCRQWDLQPTESSQPPLKMAKGEKKDIQHQHDSPHPHSPSSPAPTVHDRIQCRTTLQGTYTAG